MTEDQALNTSQATEYLRDRHGIDYSDEYLQRLARSGAVPSHKVGQYRMFRASLLDSWALGEWQPAEAR